MRCKGMKAKQHKKYMTYSCCPNKARVFYRVCVTGASQYLVSRWGGSSPVFGFCTDCATNKQDPLNWRGGWDSTSTVYRFCGIIRSIEEVKEVEANQFHADSLTEELKTQFKKMFRQKKNRKITLDEWQSLFTESIHESIIEGVMEEK